VRDIDLGLAEGVRSRCTRSNWSATARLSGPGGCAGSMTSNRSPPTGSIGTTRGVCTRP